MNRRSYYMLYHLSMMAMGDCDPAYPAMDYLADRFELTQEQRYWLAFLYQATYCAPTAWYIIQEFPDYENVDVRRLQSWWDANKSKCYFQKDRAKIKHMNQLVPMFKSYQSLVGDCLQEQFFVSQVQDGPPAGYERVYKQSSKVYGVGRFSLFLYLESLYRLTGLQIQPTGLDLKNAQTCRDGLCLALGFDDWVERTLNNQQFALLTKELDNLVYELKQSNELVDYWNVETSLCAFRKLFKSPPTRYLGYYIDRQREEIRLMEKQVSEGVDWKVLWDFRYEFFDQEDLILRPTKPIMGSPTVQFMTEVLERRQNQPSKVLFPDVGAVYDTGA